MFIRVPVIFRRFKVLYRCCITLLRLGDTLGRSEVVSVANLRYSIREVQVDIPISVLTMPRLRVHWVVLNERVHRFDIRMVSTNHSVHNPQKKGLVADNTLAIPNGIEYISGRIPYHSRLSLILIDE